MTEQEISTGEGTFTQNFRERGNLLHVIGTREKVKLSRDQGNMLSLKFLYYANEGDDVINVVPLKR